MLQEKDNIDDGLGLPGWELSICVFVCWSVCLAISIKGIETSGKVVYFLAIFPYVVLLPLLVRAVTLEGSAEGILYFIRPDWSRLMNAKVHVIPAT